MKASSFLSCSALLALAVTTGVGGLSNQAQAGSFPSNTQPSWTGAQAPNIPRAGDLIDQDAIDEIRNARCDLEVSWRYSAPNAQNQRETRTAGGSGSSANAAGRYVSNSAIGVQAVFKNVGRMRCPSFKGTTTLEKRVDGAYGGTSARSRYSCSSLAPGETCVAKRVVGLVPCPVGGGQFRAQLNRLNFDSNQRNNTYTLNINTVRGSVCPPLR